MGIARAWKAKFMLKGTAVTSVIILLMLPSLSIFRSCLATYYTGERAFPVLILSPPTPTTLTSSTIGQQLRGGQQFIILTNVTNHGEVDKAFLAITEVLDSEGVTESIGIVGGLLKVGESTKVGVSWTPQHSGNYQLKSFALSDLENPIILAIGSQNNVTVFASLQSPQDPTMPKLKVTELKGDIGPSGIPSVLISLDITDIQGNPVGGAMVSATVTDSSGYWKTFSGQTNSTGAWNFLWQLRAGYSEGLNIRVNASKYGYEEGSAETNMPISP